MFILERLLGVAAYTIALCIICIFMRKTESKKTRRKIVFVYYCVLVLLAFFYVPYVTMDLYRLLIEVNQWVEWYTWSDIIRVALHSDTPGWYLYGYLLASTGINGLIPACTVAIVYANIFSVCEMALDENGLTRLDSAAVYFYVMAVGEIFILTISNVRTAIGISIIARCVVEEAYKRKKFIDNVFLYIFAAFVHQACMIMLGLRMVTFLLEKIIYERKKVAEYLIVLAVSVIFGVSYSEHLIPYLGAVGNKILYYLNGTIYDYFWERLIGIINILVVVISIWKVKKGSVSNSAKRILLFSDVVLAAVILFGKEYAIFRRFGVLLVIVTIPIVAEILANEKIKKEGRRNYRDTYRKMIWVSSWVVLLLECIRGDLCGYKFL